MDTWLHIRDLSWPILEAITVVFAVIAARRYKLKGLWILAAASALTVIGDLLRIIMSAHFLYEHPSGMNYLKWIGVGYYTALVITVCGWGVLAFHRNKNEKPNA